MSEYKLKINGNEYNVTVSFVKGNNADVTVNGKRYQVEIMTGDKKTEIVSRPVHVSAAPSGSSVDSPLDGTIISINVRVGDTVTSGQTIAVLEAMKMENEIQAEYDGTVTGVNVEKGEHVTVGASIITIG